MDKEITVAAVGESNGQKQMTPPNRFRSKLKREGGKYIFLLSMLAVPLISFCVFWVYVNFQSILNAFRIEIRGEIVWSFANWKVFLQDLTQPNGYANMPMLLRNTMLYFSVNMVIIFPISFFLAYFLFKKIFGYKFFRVVFFLPNIISAAVLATLYKFMLNPSLGGIVPTLISKLTGSAPQNYLISDDYAIVAVLIYCIWTGFSVNMILFNGAMGRVPKEVMEAAKIDGVSMFGEMFRVIVPMIWPTLSTMIIMNFANIFIVSGPVLLLTNGAYNTSSISFWMFIITRNQESIYYPSTAGLIFTILAIPIILVVKKLVDCVFKDVAY